MSGAALTDTSAASAQKARWSALVAVLLVGAIATSAILAVLLYRADRRSADRTSASASAARFGRQLFTFDYRKLSDYRRNLLAATTGDATSEIDKTLPGLQTLIRSADSVSSATVAKVFITSIANSKTSAVVVVDTTSNGKAGVHRETEFIQLDLVKHGGSWRIEQITDLSLSPAPGLPLTPSGQRTS